MFKPRGQRAVPCNWLMVFLPHRLSACGLAFPSFYSPAHLGSPVSVFSLFLQPALWAFWFYYSKVLVVAEDDVLILKGILF